MSHSLESESLESLRNSAKKDVRRLATAFILFGAFMLLVTWGSFLAEKRIHIFGETTQASVLNAVAEEVYNDEYNHYDRQLTLHYAFSLPDGSRIKQSQIIDNKFENKIKEGDVIDLKYLSSNPEKNSLVGMEKIAMTTLIIGSIICGLFIFFGFAIIKIGASTIDKMDASQFSDE